MSHAADAVLDTLRALPRGEVDDVRKRINAYLQFGVWGGDGAAVPAVEATAPAASRVFRILAEEMQAAGLADMRDLAYFRLKNRQSFAAKAERLLAFLAEQSGERLVQDAILRIGVQLLIRQFQRFAAETDNFTVSVEVLARNIHKLPARLDREFPGYGACGMLHLLVPAR